jgi:triosephosphate isomerase (TIM)
MRKPLVAGNWKMFKTIAETRHLIPDLVPGLQSIKEVDKVVCPPFTALLAASALLEGTDIYLGAQNVHWEASGAYTGEIAPPMVAELCQFVILGHSERRTYFGDTDETVNLKTRAALKYGLIPIVCVGETLAENEAGRTEEVVSRQVRDGLVGLDLSPVEGELALIIAYEPVWAIGTGKAATAEGANDVIQAIIRRTFAERIGNEASQAVRVLYGGSVKPDNAAEFFDQPDIDGALVGGASLKAVDFIQITQAARPK